MASGDWWQTTFGDLDYWQWEGTPSPKRTLADVGFIEQTLALPAGARLLDIACGLGRHALEFARRGYQVTAFDWSEPFLEQARQKAAEAGVEIAFVRGDMRAMEFDTGFDGAYLWENTFGMFSDADNLAVLRGVARALKPDGRFVVSNNAPRTIGTPGRTWRGDPEKDEWVSLLEYEPFDVRQHRNSLLVTLWNTRTGERKQHRWSTREYTFPEMTRMLAEAGLCFAEVYGDDVDWSDFRADGDPWPFTPAGFTHRSAQRVILATKGR